MHFKKVAATAAAFIVSLAGTVAIATPAQAGTGLVPIAKPSAVVSDSAGLVPIATHKDKPYKASTKEKSARKGTPAEYAVFACPCFNYVVARQGLNTVGATADGLAANLPVENMFLKTTAPSDYHTLAQLHLKSAGNEAIEYGITVDKGLFGDTQPRLFAGFRKNGVWQGYGVGFVDYAGNSITYGTAVTVTPGTQRRFEIKYSGGNWWLAYNGGWIGYIPGSSFAPDTFVNADLAQVFMEVASPNAQSCSDMGNGLPASNSSASRLGSINLTGLVPSTTAVNFTGSVEPSTAIGYSINALSATTFRGGGPGADASLTSVGTTGAC